LNCGSLGDINIVQVNSIKILDIFFYSVKIYDKYNFVSSNCKISPISSNKVSHKIWLDVFEYSIDVNYILAG